MSAELRIARAEATDENLKFIIGLVDEAAEWLRGKGTDQWAKPWPTPEGRNERFLRGMRGGKTWILWDGPVRVGTVTVAEPANPAVWPEEVCTREKTEPAIHVHRLIVARSHEGKGLGADLVDWAGQRARREYQAQWIRIDVWTSNKQLHKYYERTGFEYVGLCADVTYPARALFQKPLSAIEDSFKPSFAEEDDGLPLMLGRGRLPGSVK